MATKKCFLTIALLLLKINLISSKKEVYEGTSFPKKYFFAETLVPTAEDLYSFLLGTEKVLIAISKWPNMTDPNRALGVFYMRSILKRTVLENGKKLNDTHRTKIKDILKQGDWIMGHSLYKLRENKRVQAGYKRFIELLRDDTVQTQTISRFNNKRLAKWIVSPNTVNNFAKQFDEITLSKEKYAKLVESVKKHWYVIDVDNSDYCLSSIIYNRLYFDERDRQCTADRSCASLLYRSPSVAYSLSHRLLNLMMPRQTRRCYMRSGEADDKLMEGLCASMYRETVYLARRGYFFRDLFMEHIALCGLLGHREFFRLHWFRKVLSWIDDGGCIKENMNFEHARTKVIIAQAKTEKKKNLARQIFREMFHDPCSFHQMALSLMMLAHGVRYAAEFMA